MPGSKARDHTASTVIDVYSGPAALRRDLEQMAFQVSGQGDTNHSKNRFVLEFIKTMGRVEQAILGEIVKQEQVLALLLKDIETAIASQLCSPRHHEEFMSAAYVQVEHSKILSDKIQDFAVALVEVARNTDASNGSTLEQACQRRLDYKPWLEGSLSNIVVLYSDVFEALRELKQSSTTKGDRVWVAPDSFERSTSKYWVDEASLSKLLMTCASEAPLLVYGRSGRLSRKDENSQIDTDNLLHTMSSKISSVYFDSPQLDLYRERLARREGAQLLRARWYGSRPKPNKQVFLELKTHHESWVNVKSVKERVAILEKDMAAFVDFGTPAWTPNHSKQLVLQADPSLSGEKLAKAVDLLLRMRALVKKHKLRPLVRSTYDRLAFQSSKSNSLRLTLDRNIIVSDESHVQQGQWCIREEPEPDSNRSRTIPFSVFEIKLGEGQESTRLNECIDNGTILDAAKFSKFLTGAATFNSVETLPYWTDHPAFSSFFASSYARADDGTPDTSSSEHSFRSASVKPTAISMEIIPELETTKSSQATKLLPFLSKTPKSAVAWVAPKKAVRVEPKTYFANERTFIQWVSAALFLVTTSALLLEFENGQGYAKLTSKALLMFALVISLYSLMLYYNRIWLVANARPYGYVSHFGPIVLTGAAVCGTWIILSKLRRTELADFVASEAIGATANQFIQEHPHVCMSHDVSSFSPLEFEPSDALVDEERGLLLVPSLSEIYGFPLPEWTNDELEIPLDATPIVVAEVARADFEAATFAGDTLYAISEVETTSSEFSAFLFSFERSEFGLFQPSSQWKLAAPEAEGMALVPQGVSASLLVSGQRGTGPLSAIVQKFKLPEPNGSPSNPPLLEVDRVLNNKVLDENMEDPKIGAMFFFEGLLYILHDNARVVRVWNMDTGSFQAEWSLPGIANGNGKQWEGLALQRVRRPDSVNQPSSLRGANGNDDSVLLLHLTHDTPAAVWTVVVEEGNVPGSIILPPCAGVAYYTRDNKNTRPSP